MMKVKDLKVGIKVDEILLQITRKGDTRAFAGKTEGTVCNTDAKDEDDNVIGLTLWNTDINKYDVDDVVKVTEGRVTEFNNKLQISGRLELFKA